MNDKATSIKVIKWTIRLGLVLWVCYWVLQIFVGDLGASPALELNHKLGLIALTLLSANLILGIFLNFPKGPLKELRKFNSERRFWGVFGFLVLIAHVGFYFLNEGFESKAWTQLYSKTYLIFASASLLILFFLAVTSNNFSMKKLGGKNWKRIHRLVYVAQVLLFGHILLIEKADLKLFVPWLAALLILQLARWILVWRRN